MSFNLDQIVQKHRQELSYETQAQIMTQTHELAMALAGFDNPAMFYDPDYIQSTTDKLESLFPWENYVEQLPLAQSHIFSKIFFAGLSSISVLGGPWTIAAYHGKNPDDGNITKILHAEVLRTHVALTAILSGDPIPLGKLSIPPHAHQQLLLRQDEIIDTMASYKPNHASNSQIEQIGWHLYSILNNSIGDVSPLCDTYRDHAAHIYFFSPLQALLHAYALLYVFPVTSQCRGSRLTSREVNTIQRTIMKGIAYRLPELIEALHEEV